MEMYRHQQRGYFHSKFLHWNEVRHRQERRTFKGLLKSCAKRIIESYIYDNMKAPLWNPAQPALFAPSSFDIYFGENKFRDNELICRPAYGSGSGSSTVGLDPRFARLHAMFPELCDLRELVQKHLERQYKMDNMTMNCKFNQASVKLYYDKKVTRNHCDIAFKAGHKEPTKNNSQVPGTPVVICVVGDTKMLEFTQYKVREMEKLITTKKGVIKKRKAWVTQPTGRKVRFVQDNACVILMDGRDEFLSNENTFWKHKSYLVDPQNGVSMSIMFRVVQNTSFVEPVTGLKPNATVGGKGKKEKQFNKGWKEIENDLENYQKRHDTVVGKIRRVLKEYCE
jgi:hypothetical protein